MRWFRDHPRITLTIIIILILLIIFYVSVLFVGKDNAVGRVVTSVVITVQKPFLYVGDLINGKVTSFTSADEIKNENEELKTRIADLENELAKEKLNKSELKELEQLSKAFNNQKTMNEYKPVVGEIVSYDGSNVFNVFTVDAGSNAGVSVNDAVINDQGLIGRVSSVGKNWSKIVAIIDESNKTGILLNKNLRYRGVSQGSGKDDLSGYFFDADAPAKEGDIVITSGIGGVYPPGLTVGTISGQVKDKNGPLKNVTIEPAVNFKSIKKVAILTGYTGE